MILFTALLLALIGLGIVAVVGGISTIVMFGDVIIFVGIIALIVKLFVKKGKS